MKSCLAGYKPHKGYGDEYIFKEPAIYWRRLRHISNNKEEYDIYSVEKKLKNLMEHGGRSN